MFRWALLSNTTISPLVLRLRNSLGAFNETCEIFFAEYGEALQQVFLKDSRLVAFNPDLITLYLDVQQIRPSLELSLAFETQERREQIMGEIVEYVLGLVRSLRASTSATLLVSNFPVPPRGALGVGLDHIFRSALRRTNLIIESEAVSMPQCHVLDCDSLWAEAGWSQRDRRFEAIAQMPVGRKLQELIVSEWLRYFRSLQGLSRKCIVVDLDNTLWKGTLGEDGPQGLQMGDTPEGRGFRNLQLALKALVRRGIILAINSKNNREDALEVIRSHPDMVLREKDFAAVQINWDDKGTNLSRIASELNVALRHVVFLDDSPLERGWVRERHPEVLVPEMPRDSSAYCDVLPHCELDSLTVTEEDRRRAEMYWEERQRRAFQAQARTYQEFLHDLKLNVEIEPIQPSLLERGAQLCQRTNQFNLTTRRYTAEQLKSFAEKPNAVALMMCVRDRFGDYGWSGLALATREGKLFTIDSFLLSCRVLGKNVEFALFSALVGRAAQHACVEVRGLFLATSKNKPCAGFYQQCGMRALANHAEAPEQWFSANLTELPILPIGHIRSQSN